MSKFLKKKYIYKFP